MTSSQANQSIGIIDSGVGGLSVWQEIIKQLPQESTIYLADSKHIPYGTRTDEEIFYLATNMIEFLQKQQIKLLVVACNTISVACLDRLRQTFPSLPMIGTVPVVKKAAELSKTKKIGIFSTEKTAASHYQQELIKKFASDCRVTNIGSNKIAPLIEAGETETEEFKSALKNALEPLLNKNIDVIALGCTHYPFVMQQIQAIVGEDVKLLESGIAIARRVEFILDNHIIRSIKGNSNYQFATTGDADEFLRIAKQLVREPVSATIAQVEHIDL